MTLGNRAVRESPQGFPRTARLLKADEFATLFRMRPLRRSEHFVVYARERLAGPPAASLPAVSPSAAPLPGASPLSASVPQGSLVGRMGLVLGKKSAPRAATRNMVRRAVRETFRARRVEYDGWDLLIRMHARFDKQRFPGAASPGLKRVCRAEVIALLDEASRQIARRKGAGAVGRSQEGGVVQAAPLGGSPC